MKLSVVSTWQCAVCDTQEENDADTQPSGWHWVYLVLPLSYGDKKFGFDICSNCYDSNQANLLIASDVWTQRMAKVFKKLWSLQ